MRQIEAFSEKISREEGSSISLLNRRLASEIPFQWHHHPEYELTLTLNSRGQRFIGDHVGNYEDGDLVLVGPNLPHTWFSREKVTQEKPHVALVIWFHPRWMESVTQNCVEFSRIQTMLARAERGLCFAKGGAAVGAKFEHLFVCRPAERLLHFLSILQQLTGKRAETLASHSPAMHTPPESRERIDRVLSHVHAGYTQAVRLKELAGIAALSESAMHRLFLKHTGKTVSDYLMHLRVGEACARLSGTSQAISFIAEAVGYPSLANFNRQFRGLKGMTPREYRRLFSE